MYQKSQDHIRNCLNASKLGSAKLKEQRLQRIKEYSLNPIKCLNCGGPIPYEKKSSNKYCSRSCAVIVNNRGRERTEESKIKTRRSILKTILSSGSIEIKDSDRLTDEGRMRKCAYSACGKEFLCKLKRSVCCSIECAAGYRRERITPEKRQEMSEKGRKNIRKQAAAGKWKGWSGRSEPSYPEKYITEKLTKDGFQKGVDYQFDMPQSGYFIDFAFTDIKLAFEVDGKQHYYPEHKERDERKDKALTEGGWVVARLPWFSVEEKK